MNYFDMVGIRDYKQPFKYVPCASCMHPALAKKYPIKNKVIWFEHKKQLIKATNFGSDSIPRFINSGGNMEQTIELLGSAETIITNSYHGAYWGALLGRKVIVTEPWSTKFYGLKHKPYILTKLQVWNDIIDDVATYPHALEECVQLTKNYWQEVQQL
jgi:exopolysaccharide biosynthesis predicted pyruvyltransferase EpsI